MAEELYVNTYCSFAATICSQIHFPSPQLTVPGVCRSPTTPEVGGRTNYPYRPPFGQSTGHLSHLEDFNASHINRQAGSCSVPSSFSNKTPFQVSSSSTRFRVGNNPSILVLAFTNYPDHASSLELLPPLGESDHLVILLELQIQLQGDQQLTSLCWSYQKTKTFRGCHCRKIATVFVIGKRHRHVAHAQGLNRGHEGKICSPSLKENRQRHSVD